MQVTTLLNRIARVRPGRPRPAPPPVVREPGQAVRPEPAPGQAVRAVPEPGQAVRALLARAGRPGVRLAQLDGTTCGPMAVLVARLLVDPDYAGWLIGDPDSRVVAGRIAAEQRRIHARANRLWPRRLGTTPWGMVAVLGQELPGVRYRWWLVDDTDPASVVAGLDRAGAAVAAGHPVPVLVGARLPRHWVLLTGRQPAGGVLVFFNPVGRTVRLAETELAAGGRAGLSWPHLQAVVVPG